MLAPLTTVSALLLAVLSIAIIYTDTKYRRIPNSFVIATLICGLSLNTYFGGSHGLLMSVGGFVFAFAVMLLFHVLGAMGAGDVKLFGAVGSIVGVSLVLPTLLTVIIFGGALAACKMIYTRTTRATLLNVGQFFAGPLMGAGLQRFEATAGDRRRTIPYGVAICVGSLISLFVFRA